MRKKVLYLLRNFARRQSVPLLNQFLKHADGPTPLHLSELPESTQFGISHPHIILVCLRIGFGDRLQLSGRRCLYNLGKRSITKVVLGPLQKSPKISLANPADRIDVAAATIVFGEITAQCLVNIASAEDEQRPLAVTHPRQGLREQITEHHPQTRLDILECLILRVRTTLHFETRCLPGDTRKKRFQRSNERVHVDIQMIRAYLLRQASRAPPRLAGTVLRPEITSIEQSIRKYTRVFENVGRFVIPQPPPYVSDNRQFLLAHRFRNELAHRTNKRRDCTAIRTTGKRNEVSLGTRTTQIIPQPTSRAEGNLLFRDMITRLNRSVTKSRRGPSYRILHGSNRIVSERQL